MKFGKRTRSWAANGIRILTERVDEEEGILSEPQPRALQPEPQQEEEAPMSPPAPPQEDEPLMSGDPTQKLLTSLGRFQRQVNRAEEGKADDAWTDECMHQLITGIEIAVENDWSDVQEALTDTARILQSYEDVHSADESVPFLQDSYEILCLMVGDLIVDNVRSGVMQKWRQRYHQAVRDLNTSGYDLVEDDGGKRPAVIESPAPAETPAWADEEMEDREDHGGEGAMDSGASAFPDNVTPFRTLDGGGARAERTPARAPEGEPATPAYDAETGNEDDAPFETPDSFFTAPLESEAPEMPSSDFGMDSEGDADETTPFDTPAAADAPGRESLMDWGDEEEGMVLPALDEERGQQEEEETLEGDDSYDAWLKGATATEEAEGPVVETAPLEEMATVEAEAPDTLEELEEEVPVPVETPTVEEAPVLEESIEEVEMPGMEQPDLFGDGPEETPESEAVQEELIVSGPSPEPEVEAVAPQPEPEAVAPVDPNSPEALLQIAQQAMSEGKMADARGLALKLAARMAQLEADRAEAAVDEATHALEENAAAIREAESGVKQAESDLAATREDKATRETTRKEQLKANQKLQGEAEGVEGTIADLEEQIRQLQEKRAAEQASLETLRASLDEGNAELEAIEAEITSLEAAVESGELSLEQARAQVATLEEERAQREEVLASAEEALARQWSGVEDINRTYRAVTGESLEEELKAEEAGVAEEKGEAAAEAKDAERKEGDA